MRTTKMGILYVFFMILPIALLFGATFDPASIKKDPKFFYGFGTAKTVQEAQQLALNDLISDALTGTSPVKNDSGAKLVITSEMSKSFPLGNIKPFINQKDNGVFAIGYRISRADWTKLEAPRETALRTDLVGQFKSISADASKPLQDRMVEAGMLLARLSKEGLYDALAETDGGNILLSKVIEKFYTDLVTGLNLALTPESGLVHSASTFVVTVTTKDNKPLAGLPVAATWRSSKKTAPVSIVESDTAGKLTIGFPADDAFKNRSVWLSISTSFSAKVPDSRFLVDLDKAFKHEFSYRQLEAAATMAANEIMVTAGPFQAGALKHDRRASLRQEKPRTVTLKAFAMDRYPVTNALYAAYLDDAKVPESDYPDYWDNPDYNQPDQPVIGISWEDANKFAKWLSSRIGYTKRLPTENEYERAARGGQPFVYPWGDQPPTDTVRANYNGNKRFDATSPVGSFENGKNPLGIYDMSGNVWEWTSSGPDANMDADSTFKIIKGGSWMDGPSELRVSNRQARDPAQRYQDVGFRLVREVTQ